MRKKTSRIGESKKMINGLVATIVEYVSNKEVFVEFEDGVKRKTTYRSFTKGTVKHPDLNYSDVISIKQQQKKLGEKSTTRKGLEITIVEYTNAQDIVVMFKDGSTKRTNYNAFKKGNVAHESSPVSAELRKKLSKERIGESKLMNGGENATIIKYINCEEIYVEFGQGEVVRATYHHFCRGAVRNPYAKTIRGIGYLGIGVYSARNKNIYSTWKGMFDRAYDEKNHEKYPTYRDVKVSPKWHCLQDFGRWYEENFYTIGDEVMCLDKDILVKNNKLYSPETCVFVPKTINSLFLKKTSDRGNFPLGVSYDKQRGKYVAQCQSPLSNKKVLQKRFDTVEEAFLAYKEAKESVIKDVANHYKGKIPDNLYEAMMNYQVEITD